MRKFIEDITAQDIIEYMLLTAFIALTSYAGINYIENAMKDFHVKQDKAIQNIWETPNPIGE